MICISGVNAADYDGGNIIGAENNQDFTLEYRLDADAISVHNDDNANGLVEDITEDGTDKVNGLVEDITEDDNSSGSFTDLNKDINGNEKNEITLTRHYLFNGTDIDDSRFTEGISINRTVTINGNGITIDGANLARLFYICPGANVKFLNINFINGHFSEYVNGGGAIYAPSNDSCVVENSTFKGNIARCKGGAMYAGTAINCIFRDNKAGDGGAMSKGTAINCTFSGNKAVDGGAMQDCSAVNCNLTSNSGEWGGAMNGGIAINCRFGSNSTEDYGGAMYGCSAVNCTVSNNKVKRNGGAMYMVMQ